MNNKEFAKTLLAMLKDANSKFPLVGDGIQVDEVPTGFLAQKFSIVVIKWITRKKFHEERIFIMDSDLNRLSNDILKWFWLVQMVKSKKVKSNTEKSKKASWISEIKTIIQWLWKVEFSFDDIYKWYEPHLKATFPNNTHPKSSVLRSLQILRDQWFIEFAGRWLYKVI